MSDLGAKLRKMKLGGKLYVKTDSLDRYVELSDEAIAQILQAVKEAGYRKQTVILGDVARPEGYSGDPFHLRDIRS